jgi:sugar phosphate isomerase/epimerase
VRDYLHSFMKVGIIHHQICRDSTIGSEIMDHYRRIAEDEFFGGVEVRVPVPAEIRNDLMNLLQSSILLVGIGGGPSVPGRTLNPSSPDPAVRKDTISYLKELVDEAYLFKAVRLTASSGPVPPAKEISQAKKLFAESLEEVCEYAEGRGNLVVAAECMDRDVDRKRLLGPARDAAEVAALVRRNHANFGLVVDLGHIPLLGESADHAITVVKDYLVHAHIGNCLISDKSNPLYGDKHPPFGTPGTVNDVDQLEAFLKALLKIGYIGPGKQNMVSFEVRPLDGQLPEVIIANSKRTLMEAWAKLQETG